MIEGIKKSLEQTMDSAIESLKYQLSKVRTGRASARVLDGVVVLWCTYTDKTGRTNFYS